MLGGIAACACCRPFPMSCSPAAARAMGGARDGRPESAAIRECGRADRHETATGLVPLNGRPSHAAARFAGRKRRRQSVITVTEARPSRTTIPRGCSLPDLEARPGLRASAASQTGALVPLVASLDTHRQRGAQPRAQINRRSRSSCNSDNCPDTLRRFDLSGPYPVRTPSDPKPDDSNTDTHN